ncbi:MAG: DEAD/DEAH box helicase [Legionellales bacterium]|nr:DEAD/DEAH box helicase [Legionellales bacterium]
MTQEFTRFAELQLSAELLQALEDLNFHTPSPIQQQAIPRLLEGRDLIGQAQTGTGKTAAFALPILQRLSKEASGPQALILAPTRELAIQVAAHFESLSTHRPWVRVTVLCGGQDYRPQLTSLRDGAQIVVGTPGRILDHLDRGTLKLSQLKSFVLDEADEMLKMGFIEDVETILEKLPAEKQIALFSATMPPRIRQIAQRYLKDPVSVEIRMDTATVKSTEQRFLFAAVSQKPEALLRILGAETCQGVIVFARTKSSTEEIAEILLKHGHRAMAIHGDLTQSLRERIIVQFKQGVIDVLVATDVAARGLDVDRVTHVINYDMAHDCETYVHRIGRTGRAGRSGITILFVTPKESRMLTILERHTRQRIEKINIPNDHMIQEAKQKQFMANISERLQHEYLPSYRHMIEAYLKENDVSAVDVASVLALLLQKDKAWKHEISLPKPERFVKEARVRRSDSHRAPSPIRAVSSENKRPRADYPQELFRIDVGRVHGVKPGNIVGAIANEAGLQSRFITGLKIHDDHSTVRLPKGMAKEVVHDLNNAWVCGRQLKLTSLGIA